MKNTVNARGVLRRIGKKKAPDSTDVKGKDYRRFLDILISPRTGEPLTIKNKQLVTKYGELYRVVQGIPVLVLRPEKMHLASPSEGKISRNIEEYKVPNAYNEAKLVLHLGSGNVKCNDKRVISLDILPCSNVDVVGEAEALPFQSNSFDLVESGAVFEHVYDPLAAISEVKRVLKPGGVFRIDNSFLQPYHGFPSHYFAMTPQANETFLIDDFIMIESSIPESGTPLMTLSMVLERFLINLNHKQKEEIMNMPLKNVLSLIKSDRTNKNRLMKDFSEFETRSLAASHVVIARKPDNYEQALESIKNDSDELERWNRLKREYYTLRTEVMLRHHEIFAYKRFSLEINRRCSFGSIKFPSPIEVILGAYLLINPLDIKELKQKVEGLREQEELLVGVRDAVIKAYLGCKDSRR